MDRVDTATLVEQLGVRPGKRAASFSAARASIRLDIPVAVRGVPSAHG